MLEAVRIVGGIDNNPIRFYQASSSEMFGKVRETPQTELTPFHPRSPYGVAKVFGHHMTVNYREAYGIHASSGILFNHESAKRGLEFVTRKITNSLARIKLGLQDSITLGNLDSARDWGYAGDYVEAMWLMLQQDEPDDYVIATGETHTIREFLDVAFRVRGLRRLASVRAARTRASTVRPRSTCSIGDATKAREKLGWEPKVDFEGLVRRMYESDLAEESAKAEAGRDDRHRRRRTARRRDHGQRLRPARHAGRGRRAHRVRRRARGAGRLGAPHARRDVRVRAHRRRPRPARDHRRRRRRRAPAGHDRVDDVAAGDRRARARCSTSTASTRCCRSCRCPTASPSRPSASGKARNAGLLAVRILGADDDALRTKLDDHRAALDATVREKDCPRSAEG